MFRAINCPKHNRDGDSSTGTGQLKMRGLIEEDWQIAVLGDGGDFEKIDIGETAVGFVVEGEYAGSVASIVAP